MFAFAPALAEGLCGASAADLIEVWMAGAGFGLHWDRLVDAQSEARAGFCGGGRDFGWGHKLDGGVARERDGWGGRGCDDCGWRRGGRGGGSGGLEQRQGDDMRRLCSPSRGCA